MQETFTREEVIELMLIERQRAVDITYEFKQKYDQKHADQKSVGWELAFVSEEVADTCRIVGNAIGGLNALSITLGTTKRDLIEKDLIELEKLLGK